MKETKELCFHVWEIILSLSLVPKGWLPSQPPSKQASKQAGD
jgi:hypothetical protein